MHSLNTKGTKSANLLNDAVEPKEDQVSIAWSEGARGADGCTKEQTLCLSVDTFQRGVLLWKWFMELVHYWILLFQAKPQNSPLWREYLVSIFRFGAAYILMESKQTYTLTTVIDDRRGS